MNPRWLLGALATLMISFGCNEPGPATTPRAVASMSEQAPQDTVIVKLPGPDTKGEVSVEEALLERRSVREYGDEGLSLRQTSQLLWAAQGMTSDWGGRTAPSAGGLYPLEVYLVAGKVKDFAAGVYKYRPAGHELTLIRVGDLREKLSEAALGQEWVRDAPATIVIAAVLERTTAKYGDRGIRYVWMEAGHAGQNVCLQATALGLGAVTVGAFDDSRVQAVLGMPKAESSMYVIPVGNRR